MVADLPGSNVRRLGREIQSRGQSYERNLSSYKSELNKYKLTREEYEKRVAEYKKTYDPYLKKGTRGRTTFTSTRPLGQRVIKNKFSSYKKASKELSAKQIALADKREKLIKSQKGLTAERAAIGGMISKYKTEAAKFEQHQRNLQIAYGSSGGMEVTTAGMKYITDSSGKLIGVEDSWKGESRMATPSDTFAYQAGVQPQIDKMQSTMQSIRPPTDEEIKEAQIPQKTYVEVPKVTTWIQPRGGTFEAAPTEPDNYFDRQNAKAKRIKDVVQQDVIQFRYGNPGQQQEVGEKYAKPALLLISGAAGVSAVGASFLGGAATVATSYVGGFSLGGAIGAGAGVLSLPVTQAAYYKTNIELGGREYKELSVKQSARKWLASEGGRLAQAGIVAGGVSWGLSRFRSSYSLDTSKTKFNVKKGTASQNPNEIPIEVSKGSYATTTERYPFRAIQEVTRQGELSGSGFLSLADDGTTYAKVDYQLNIGTSEKPLIRAGKLSAKTDPFVTTPKGEFFTSQSTATLQGQNRWYSFLRSYNNPRNQNFVGKDLAQKRISGSVPGDMGETKLVTEYSNIGLGSEVQGKDYVRIGFKNEPYSYSFDNVVKSGEGGFTFDKFGKIVTKGKPSVRLGRSSFVDILPAPKSNVIVGGKTTPQAVETFSYLKPTSTSSFEATSKAIFTPTTSGSSLTPTVATTATPLGRTSDYLPPSTFAGTGQYELQSGAAPKIIGATPTGFKPQPTNLGIKTTSLTRVSQLSKQRTNTKNKNKYEFGQASPQATATTLGTRYTPTYSYATTTAQATRTRTSQKQGTELGYFGTPPPTPPPPPPFGGFGGGFVFGWSKGKPKKGKSKKGKSTTRKRAYKPSLTALGLPATKSKPLKRFTGLELRRVRKR